MGRLGEKQLDQDAVIDPTIGCSRCGLRGAHECLPSSAVAYLGRREEPSGIRHSYQRGPQ
jgi:hypothetical protein